MQAHRNQSRSKVHLKTKGIAPSQSSPSEGLEFPGRSDRDDRRCFKLRLTSPALVARQLRMGLSHRYCCVAIPL